MNIIKLLGIEYKEDIISNLLVAFIKKSESFKKEFIENLIGIDFNEITDLDISIRTKTSVGIPDIVLYINTRNKSKLVVIENKLKAKEGVNQTLRYSDKQCIKELLEKSKLILYKDNVEFIGVFLTLVPERNYTGEVFKNITYKDILNKIECKIEDRTLDKLYRDFREVLNEFYNNLDVDCNESILEIFKKETDAERAIIKFTKIIKSINLNNGLIIDDIDKINGRGRNSFFVKISKDLWKGSKKAELIKGKYSVNEETYDIHLEFTFDSKNKNIALPLHYETNPYIPHNKLLKKSEAGNYAKYHNRRERIKINIHDEIKKHNYSNIKPYNGTNQIAKIIIDLDEKTTVKEFVDNIGKEIIKLSEIVDGSIIKECRS